MPKNLFKKKASKISRGGLHPWKAYEIKIRLKNMDLCLLFRYLEGRYIQF